MPGLQKLLEKWKDDPAFMSNVTHWAVLPATEGSYAPFPAALDQKLVYALSARGITRLYSHQAEAIEAVLDRRHTVVVTPTASGKTLCYNLPVLNSILKNPECRALYIFPTKALSQDQLAELRDLSANLELDLRASTYDGDTDPGIRRFIRHNGQIVVTNPDMLHTAILPHHTKWVKLFQNLEYVVIDEMHQYRGVFGSHFANVLRRLRRICRFYGSSPRFILCSATIANPGELAETLIEEPVTAVTRNGAPRSEKHFIFFNPPLVNPELGIRRSSLLETRRIAAGLIKNGIQTIIFTRSRLAVEVLLSYLQRSIKSRPGEESIVKGYRGGYLPQERRAIEDGLRRGTVRAVVSTNALELGIDIGQLDACIINGYPGTIASTWQQSGRAGRRSGLSLAVLVAGNDPLNQFIAANPDYFFRRSPERALVNPDNLVIFTNHVRCAAFELPFEPGECYGGADIEQVLDFLTEEQVLFKSAGRYHWMDDAFPAEEVSLRSATRENVLIIDITSSRPEVIGEVDRFSAPMLVHEEAIYMHGGQQYQVEKLDFAEKKAYIRQVEVNYFTDANLSVDLKVLDCFDSKEKKVKTGWGEVRINALVSMFKKIKFNTHENLGSGPVNIPETEMHTTAFWLSIPHRLLGGMTPSALQAGLLGLSNLLPQVAVLFLMSDPQDLQSVCQIKSPYTGEPTIYLYDNFPGGVGYSQELFKIYRDIFQAAGDVIRRCPCGEGCPSCTGPAYQVGESGKENALQLVEVVLR